MHKIHPHFSLAFVTGASSGIGAAVCRLLARQGIPLLITGRRAQHLKALADELKLFVPVEVIIADIAVKEECRRLVDKIYERVPDLIVNNAGFGLYGLALTHETEGQQSMVAVNVLGMLELTLEGARALVSAGKKGVILNVSSSADSLVFPGLATYAASKAFVTQFSRSFDEEMRSYGIRILTSCPGVVATEFRSRASGVVSAKPDKSAMTASFAAEQIWEQIIRGWQVHRFDWKTRLGVFCARFLLPQGLVSKILFRATESYHPLRAFIKKP
jgi:uncharacterized protein